MTRGRVISVVTTWAVVSAALWLSDADPSLVALAGIVAVGAALGFAAWDVGAEVQRVEWPPPRPARDPSDVDDQRVARTLRDARDAVRSDSTQLHERLVDLVDDRLLAHHDIDRARQPDEADELLTPALRRLLAGPRRRAAAPRELRTILTDIEAL